MIDNILILKVGAALLDAAPTGPRGVWAHCTSGMHSSRDQSTRLHSVLSQITLSQTGFLTKKKKKTWMITTRHSSINYSIKFELDNE